MVKTDLVAELRSWVGFPKKDLDLLIDQAADEIERLRGLNEDRRWIASLLTHLEDNWRAIDEGPIKAAREYLMRAIEVRS